MPIAMRRLILLVVALDLCIHHTPPSSAATSVEALSPGRSLAAGDKLVSGNGKFALGFFELADAGSKSSHDTTESHWHLGIWFNKIPKFTPVWVANRENPLADPSSSELTFSEDGNLVLLNRANNSSTVWSSQSQANVTTNNATVLVLLDTGNLVLRSSANASVVRWQSFDHPTDTLLPDATIGLDKVTSRTRRLVSRKNLLDQSPGVYSMELGVAGVVQLLWNSSVAYWSSGDWNGQGQYFDSVPGMTVRHLFDFSFVDDDREVSFAYHLRDESDTMYSILDVSGQRKVFVWHESTQVWLPIYSHPEAQCDAHAACGPFGVCSDDNALQLGCSCLKGFSVASPGDWELDDRTSGCKRDIPLDCGGGGGNRSGVAGPTDRFYAVAAVRLPYDPRSVGGPVTSAAECEQDCLSTCSCSGYSFGTGGCSVWHGALLNVKHLHFADATAGADEGEVLYLRLAAEEFQTRKKNRGLIVATGIASLGVLIILVFVLLLMARRNPHKLMKSLDVDSGLVAFRYRDLQRATRDFSDKIGAGGFGSVFKGSLNESTTIAVKRLNGSYRVEKQFRAEVSSVGILRHTNLVKMIGFCCERDRRLLVYEHMPNLSLDVHLFRSRSRSSAAALSWSTRYRIALGVARGLSYLHESCRDRVIHCDVKPQNILLDASLEPRIADFGMAKLMARDLSRVLTTTRGTVGYLAPEWISGMAVTPKVDVYAYGMVLLEIVSGRMNSEAEEGSCSCSGSGEDDAVYFPVQVARKLLQGDVMSLVDRRLGGDAVVEEVERACKVACWCIQDSQVDRPTMGKVVQILEGLVELDMPPVPRLLAAVAGRSHLTSS